MQTQAAILTINSGSSSLKASLFRADGTRQDWRYEHIGQGYPHDQRQAFDTLMQDMGNDLPTAVGHRLVHGGNVTAARLIDDAERVRLTTLIPLAPLHLPGNLLGVDLCRERFASPQIACFDTAFHATLPAVAQRLPIPAELGLRRYGFHGINYAHIAQRLPALMGEAARGKIVVAHLGSGASLCLLENLLSVDTTMGYSPAGGIPMGTRSGDLDPGVMLTLAQRFSHDELTDLVYHRMGLIALSDGENSDMAQLLANPDDAAVFAVDYFCREVRGAIGALAAKAGSIDALIFTAGIGEHAALIRTKICEPLKLLGFELNTQANIEHHTLISSANSKPIYIIPADEESMMRDWVAAFIAANQQID